MKLVDVDHKLDEDLGDWLGNKIAKTGILGSTAKLSAEQQESQKRIYDTGLKYFKNQLNQSLQSGIKSGFVEIPTEKSTPTAQAPQQAGATAAATSTQSAAQSTKNISDRIRVAPGKRIVIPKVGSTEYYKTSDGKWYNANRQEITNPSSIEYLDNRVNSGQAREEVLPQSSQQKKTSTKESSGKYELLTQLIENRILKEQETVSGFIQDFVAGQTNGFAQNQKYQDFINRVSDNAQIEYQKQGKISDETYEKLWSTIFNWAKIGGGGDSGGGRSRKSSRDFEQDDDLSTDSNNNGVPDTQDRQQWVDSMIDDLSRLDLNNPSQKTTDIKKMKEITRKLIDFIKSSEK